MKTGIKYFSNLTIVIILAAFAVDCFAQGQVVTDISGSVVNTKKYTELNGSAYLSEQWSKGLVKFANQKILKDLDLKYNQVTDELVYAGINHQEYIFNEKINEFIITYINGDKEVNAVFKNGFPNLKGFTDRSFYEVLVDGNFKLLKKNAKDITQVKEFNSATTVQTVNDHIGYYIYDSTGIFQLKKMDIKSLSEALKNPSINEFATKNKLNPKNEGDLKKIITYLNSSN